MKHRHSRSLPRRIVGAAVIFVLSVAILLFAAYAAHWYADRARIRAESSRYSAMYGLSVPLAAIEPDGANSTAPAVSASASAATASPDGDTGADDLPIAVDAPIPTPDANTLVFAMPSAPPVLEAFALLLQHNPETVAFLQLPEMLSLPVAQRVDDNSYYLDHAFDGSEAKEGALFLDGLNRLVPEDDCLIVYGHNMRNDTMFGRLDEYQDTNYLLSHAEVRFDTIYEARTYVPFAAFSASMSSGRSDYFDVRRFLFDRDGFDDFVAELKARSKADVSVDVAYGDRLLLLVTCDYTHDAGRFIVALRELREGETVADAIGQPFVG